MKSLFEQDAYTEVTSRLAEIDEQIAPQWGKMNAAQMLHHCQKPLALAMGQISMEKPNFLKKLLFRSFKASMYNDKLWKPNLPTVKQFKVETEKQFQEEKTELLKLVDEFYEMRDKTSWEPHPSFGHFTPQQWGQMQYKHLDHHLRQFGV